MSRLLLVAAALLLSGSSAGAQIVRGVVLEAGSEAPIEGAMVVLLDFDGRSVDRVLTDAAGAFAADADHPGPHLLRIDRIGYESLTTGRFDVPVQGTVRRVLVPVRPVRLEGLDVAGSRRCSVREDQGRATARLWEEARKALEAASWTLQSGAYRYTLLNFVRDLEADGRSVKDERRRFERATGQAPYVSMPAEELVSEGFVRRNPDRTLTYFAPDAESFLSDAFLDTHCMRVGDEEDGAIGLAFEPVGGRRQPDIRGTLWLDRATAQLRRLEFRYVNLPPGYDLADPRGEVVFGQLPGGTWIVREWHIRMPLMAYRAGAAGRLFRIGYQEEGGVVWRVVDRDGTTVLEAATATVAGRVTDSLSAGPLEGALAGVAGGPAEARTGPSGSFVVAGLAPGLHDIEVRHPSLDTLGLGPVTAGVEAVAGEVSRLEIRLPGVEEALREACGADPPPGGPARSILLGRVRRGGAPAAGTGVRLLWMSAGPGGFQATARAAPPRGSAPDREWTRTEEEGRWIQTVLDDRGVFLLCHVPQGSQIRVEATLGSATTARTLTLPHGRSVVTLRLELGGSKP